MNKPRGSLKRFVGLLALIVVALVCYGVLSSLALPVPPHPFFSPWRSQRFPLVVANAGGNGLWPENTLYALQFSHDMGVDILDMDVRSSADGVLVLMHDPRVDRTTDGTGLITSLTMEELRDLDAAYNWSSDGGITFPFRNKSVTVPTLEEVFAAFPDVRMSINMQQVFPSLAIPLCELIGTYQMMDKVLVSSVDVSELKQFRQFCPQVATVGSEGELLTFSMLNLLFLGEIYEPNFHALMVPTERSRLIRITPFFLETAYNRNLRVYIFTNGNEDDIQRLINLRVDSIITDYPDIVLAALGR